ncbi:MAG: hypothetical protein Q9P01_13565 [Anaerolineae bacterium]|nr:hypothetical protein [Anaerolineae bacterium]
MPELESYQNIAEPFLHQLCDLCQATSIWLMKHDFKKRIAIVVGEYISQEANDIEKMSDPLGGDRPQKVSHPKSGDGYAVKIHNHTNFI